MEKNMLQFGFFDESKNLEKLSKLGDPLERLNKAVNWEIFRSPLEKAFKKTEQKGPGGRPPYDRVLLFKIIILQRIYNLSDDSTEFQIIDRDSFKRFLGLSTGDSIPDAKTIWFFKNELAKKDVMMQLFEIFNKVLREANLIVRKGNIVDATFVEAPVQRNTKEENKVIKEGDIPEDWKKDDDKSKHKLAQKDIDADWTKKGDKCYFGFKNHTNVDSESKFITKFTVTPASVHDSKELFSVLDGTEQVLYADSAYSGEKIASNLPKNLINKIHEKGYRNHPLTDEQKARNKEKSKIRARVEHVYAFMTICFHGLTLRSIGLVRAKFNIALTNLLYNICRLETIRRCCLA